ncbi:MAG: bifunctional folylpolyglutamate synthase/dihydrofolate synthase [Clostridia bacterium]|nr:bifunctional folylpolyglutamate synthase/dihydrofolate synthase [Clostridia bacterium]
MTYEEAIKYIHGVSSTFCKPGLERIGELCERLGNPERQLTFIHVGGTNGKGSFCSMLSSVLSEAEYKVGLYTSPYIVDFEERMRVSGNNIPKDTLVRLTERVKPIAEAMTDKPTEFELITAIAFLYFAEEKVDLVVLEVGLGGRLDSTNIIPSALLSVITGISLDHTAILGNTVKEIAGEKAGIIKHGVPVLFGGEDNEAREVIKARATLCGSPYYEVDYNSLTVKRMTLEGTDLEYSGESAHISLLGSYQPKNASVVLEAVRILREKGLKIDTGAVEQGLNKAVWHARFEIVSKEPLVIFDGAHNPEGIASAVDSIERYFKDERVFVLTGVLKDKDYQTIAKDLSRVAKGAFTITPENPRALAAEEYKTVLEGYGVKTVATSGISEGVRLAMDTASREGAPLVCLGSLYTYGEITNEIKKYKKEI